MARLKRKQSGKKIRLPKRRLIYDDKADYGEACQKPDICSKMNTRWQKTIFYKIFKNRSTIKKKWKETPFFKQKVHFGWN